MKRFLTFLVFLLLIPAGLKIEISGLTRPAEDIPEEADPDASVTGDLLLTRDNVLRILDQMDPDGAFILRSTESRADFMEYIDPSETLAEGYLSLMTAVHEQCHVYNSTPGGTRHNSIQNRISHAYEWIYIGHGLHIEVPFTDVFPSSEMNETIPESLRTYRFNTYLNGDPAQASSQFGVYGLLDEFTAYCWGTGTTMLLEGVQKKSRAQPSL